jgi:hypothetical protein
MRREAHRDKEPLIDTKPVAVLLVGILHLILDDDDPHGIGPDLSTPCPRVAIWRSPTWRKTSNPKPWPS